MTVRTLALVVLAVAAMWYDLGQRQLVCEDYHVELVRHADRWQAEVGRCKEWWGVFR